MKVLVLLSLVAACLAQSTYVGRHIAITDGTISVVGEHGREVHMYVSPVDPRKIEVVLKTPYGPNRKVEIDQTNDIHNVDFNAWDAKFFHVFRNLGSAYTQHDILLHLFREYEGVVDAVQYEELVRKIHYLVQVGVLHQSVWEILHYFDQQYSALNHLPWVPHYEQNYPEHYRYSVQHYGVNPYEHGEYKYNQYGYNSEYEHLSPVQRLYQLVQKYKYNQNQEHYPEEYHYGQYPAVYEKYQYPVGEYKYSPWMKYFSKVNKYQSYQYPVEHKESYPYGYGYQHQYENEGYHYGSYYHQYPQYYQKQWYPQQWYSSQKWWAPQQWYSSQKSWAPQQWWAPHEYYHYNNEVPQQWNYAQQHYGGYEHVPLVH